MITVQTARQPGRSGGFTMIELLIVMVIIGILAAIAIPTYLAHRDRARNAQVVEGGRTIMLAILTYVAANPNEEDPWPATCARDPLVAAGAIAESDWPGNPFAPGGRPMQQTDETELTVGDYLYEEHPQHAQNGRYQLIVVRKGAEPFVIP